MLRLVWNLLYASCDCYFHLLINFVKHSWVVVFLRVVMEADHAILLVNASIDLTIFDLQGQKKNQSIPRTINKRCAHYTIRTLCVTIFKSRDKKKTYIVFF